MTEVMNPPLPGKVPEHWKALRLKHWIGINESVLPESTDPGFEFRYMEISAVDHGRLIEFPQKTHFEVAPSRARRRVKLGDTLLSTVRTYLKAIWYAENPGDDLVCSTGFAVLTPKKGTNPKYVNYLVQSEPFTDKITAESVGTAYPAISENKLASFEVRVPPTDEQAAIVRCLDDVDQRIRAYVSAKERLIALLEEERQAVIHQAVTRGLDPNVKLKPHRRGVAGRRAGTLADTTTRLPSDEIWQWHNASRWSQRIPRDRNPFPEKPKHSLRRSQAN